MKSLFSTALLLASASSSGDGAAPAAAAIPCCSVYELRQYTLHPGRRDELIDLFEREFVEPQERAGMQLAGQFRDLDDPNRFVWIRGFSDMQQRAAALGAFYGGEVWKAQREQANATMVDSDNVLLLRPRHTAGINSQTPRPSIDSVALESPAVVLAAVYSLRASAFGAFPEFFERSLKPELVRSGLTIIATFESESSPNSFPRLPIREGEHVFVWFARADNAVAEQSAFARLRQSPGWRAAQSELERLTLNPAQQLRLQPTRRSTIR